MDGAQVLPDGRILSWSDDCNLILWDGSSGALIHILTGHTAWITGAQILQNKQILSWSLDSTLRIWDSASGIQLAILEGHYNRVIGALETRDGRIISWCDNIMGKTEDYYIYMWDEWNRSDNAYFQRHGNLVLDVLILAESLIISHSADNTLHLWDTDSGSRIANFVYQQSMEEFLDKRCLSWCLNRNKINDHVFEALTLICMLESGWWFYFLRSKFVITRGCQFRI